jgi:hypothetical protein
MAAATVAFSCARRQNGKCSARATQRTCITASALTKRQCAAATAAIVAVSASGREARAAEFAADGPKAMLDRKGAFALSEEEWHKRLSPAQYSILREASTERPFVSPLNNEKRTGALNKQLPFRVLKVVSRTRLPRGVRHASLLGQSLPACRQCMGGPRLHGSY